MLSLPSSTQVYLCSVHCDMRKSFNGLERMVEDVVGLNPLSGHLFVFFNRRRDRIKIICWDTGGYVIHYKLLEKGSFAIPEIKSGGSMRITATELTLLLQGIDLRETRRRRWWTPPIAGHG